MSIRPSSHAGFTLLETVIALAILALSLGVIYESLGWSLRRSATLEGREAAWLAAQSVLADVRSRDALRAGVEQGQTKDGLRWTARIAAHEARVDTAGAIKPFEVTIEVSWGSRDSQRIQLHSIATGRVES
jgi:general secretion pathway protein I